MFSFVKRIFCKHIWESKYDRLRNCCKCGKLQVNLRPFGYVSTTWKRHIRVTDNVLIDLGRSVLKEEQEKERWILETYKREIPREHWRFSIFYEKYLKDEVC